MYKERKAKKIYALFLAMIMVIAMAVPAFAEKAKDIKVTLTISDQKTVLASAKDGSAMAGKEVTVVDLDSSGDFSYEEALIAAHKAYCKDGEAGYGISSKFVNKFWGIETSNLSFFLNDIPIPNNVVDDKIKDGDKLYAGFLTDPNYNDIISFFDSTNKSATVNDKVTLTLTGFAAFSERPKAPLAKVKVGYWENGAFKEIAGAVTDDKGQVSFTADKEGTFIVTANGSAVVKDYIGADVTAPVMAPYCKLTVNPVPQKTQTVTVKKKTVKLKYKSVKKKKATIKASKVTKGNKAKTKLSYKLVKVNKKKSKSKFKVASNGKITVKKGTKKGTYKLTLKASAAETKEYKPASKNFQVVIIIK